MSGDSEENLLLSENANSSTGGAVITVFGSSEENVTNDSQPDGTAESSEMITDEVVSETTTSTPPSGSSGDMNTQELTEFEEGMKNLNVTLPNVTSDADVGHRSVATATTPNATSDLVQLFETCSMIQAKQKSDFPARPPRTGLMDANTVS